MRGVTIAPLFRFHISLSHSLTRFVHGVHLCLYRRFLSSFPLILSREVCHALRDARTHRQTFASTLESISVIGDPGAALGRERDWRIGSGVGFIFWRTGPLIKRERKRERVEVKRSCVDIGGYTYRRFYDGDWSRGWRQRVRGIYAYS